MPLGKAISELENKGVVFDHNMKALAEGSKSALQYILDHYRRCTGNDVSGFIRDYLSMKQQVTPKISNVYRAFKEYAENAQLPIDSLLEDLRRYARFYEKLLTCKSGLKNQKLDDCKHGGQEFKSSIKLS